MAIAALRPPAPAGERAVASVEDARFAPQLPHRSAGTTVGKTHAVRAKRWYRVNGWWFFGWLMTLSARINQPMVVLS